MLIRSLITLGAVLLTSTALAQDITSTADFVTADKANDFRGLAVDAVAAIQGLELHDRFVAHGPS